LISPNNSDENKDDEKKRDQNTLVNHLDLEKMPRSNKNLDGINLVEKNQAPHKTESNP